jgi:glycosyltransferase involved in cell wall biosynthesis
MTRVLIVSLGSTGGLRLADIELRDSLRRAGADAQIASAAAQPQVPTMMLTDLFWARAARKAALDHLRGQPAEAIIYSSTTAALMWPVPGAIRFDAPAAVNRPGRHGLFQRPLERSRLMSAPLLLPYSEGALRELPEKVSVGDRALVLPVAIRPSGPANGARDIAAITYGANPQKKGLDRVLGAWAGARAPGEELVVSGVSKDELRRCGLELPGEGVRLTGMLSTEDYRALLRRARVFVCAPRREDYGQSQLEALADGCQLVSTEAPGPYAALPLARELDPRLIGNDLASALRVALDDPSTDYAGRARELLADFSQPAIDELISDRVLPRLLAGARPR